LVDVFRDRIVFPIHNPRGEPVAFIGRAAPGVGPEVPKYLNTTDTPIYHKRRTLYGLSEQCERVAAEWAPVIVEGPIDVLAVWLAHVESAGVGRFAVATCGTALTEDHASTIMALPGAERYGVTTAYDNDSAGRAATIKAWQLLPIHAGIELLAANLPPGCDPADLITTPDRASQLRAALSSESRPLVQAVIDIQIDQLLARRPDAFSFIEGQLGVVRHLAAQLTDLPADQIVNLADYIASRTGTGPDLIADVIIDNLERPRDAEGPRAPRSTSSRSRDGPSTATPPPPGTPDTHPDRPNRRGRAFPAPGGRSGTTPSTDPHAVPGITRRRSR
jgi:DNA primase